MRCLDTAPGVEPGCAGLQPAALPLGHAVLSRRQDLNLRPPAPRAGALPSAPRLAVVVLLVGSDGFEPPASSSRTRRAAKLRYDPLVLGCRWSRRTARWLRGQDPAKDGRQ
jgi:hypothetical protein